MNWRSWLACGLVWSISTVACAQDGGQDSPLTGTQGVRALALGGAVSAWLDEPAAVWWNPATLSYAPVRRVEFQHTKNALDTRTEQFGIVFPTLDYGAWAVGAIIQTTSGIIVTNSVSPLPVSTERFNRYRLAAGYGLRTIRDIRLGATLTIAGYRFMGIQKGAWGLNLGAVPIRAGNLRVGLVVENVLRPTFSFSNGLEDQWPRRGILAAAYQFRRMVLSGQVETSQREDTRFRVGGEYSPNPVFSIRAGHDGSGVTVGMGFAHQRIHVDYAFVSPSDLGSEHRFGVSIDIGRPVSLQRRLRAEHIEYEVGIEIERRNDQSRVTLEALADTAMQQLKWRDATRFYAQLQLLFPDDVSYSQELGVIRVRRDSSLRARIDLAVAEATESERRAMLQRDIEQQLAARQWQSALGTISYYGSTEGPSEIIAELKRLAEDSLRTEVGRAEARAELALRNDRAADAAGWSRVILLLKPDHADGLRMLNQARRLSLMQRAESIMLAAASTEDTAMILEKLQALIKLDPDHELALRYLKRYSPNSIKGIFTTKDLQRDTEAWGWYTDAFVEFRAGRYVKSIEMWQKVLDRYPSHQATIKNLEQARLRQNPPAQIDH